MKSIYPIRPVFLIAAQLAVAGIFIGACLSKIGAPELFALAVYRYRILPYAFINFVAIILPWIELTTGIGILLPRPKIRSTAALIIFGMLAVFTIAISMNLLRGIDVSCGCFSTRADAAGSSAWNLVRNAVLLILSFIIWMDATFKGHKE